VVPPLERTDAAKIAETDWRRVRDAKPAAGVLKVTLPGYDRDRKFAVVVVLFQDRATLASGLAAVELKPSRGQWRVVGSRLRFGVAIQ
jgi:hypothetical protein